MEKDSSDITERLGWLIYYSAQRHDFCFVEKKKRKNDGEKKTLFQTEFDYRHFLNNHNPKNKHLSVELLGNDLSFDLFWFLKKNPKPIN